MTAPELICYPPAALNGGALESAPPKVGDWVWQPKVDDWRAVIHAPSGTVWSQYGERSSIGHKFQAALDYLRAIHSEEAQFEWLDAGLMNNRNDMMRGSIVLFDLIVAGQEQWLRRTRLSQMFAELPDATILCAHPGRAHERVYLVPQVAGEAAGRKLYADLQEQNAALGRKFYEGVVAKRATSLYTFGRSPKQATPDWIKHRFDQR